MSSRSYAGVPVNRVARRRPWSPRATIPPAAGRVPLSALRATLDDGSAQADWALHPDGVLGRALMMPAGATFTVPLTLGSDVSFSARAMLLPHDWRDARGAVRASVKVTGPDGRQREIWSATLRASDRGRPRGLRARLPAPGLEHRPAAQHPGHRGASARARSPARSGSSRRSPTPTPNPHRSPRPGLPAGAPRPRSRGTDR